MELNGFWPCIGICWLVMKGLAPPMGIWPPIILLLGICCDMKGFPIPMFYCPIIYYYCIKAVLYWFCMAWAIMLVIMFCCCCWCVWNDDMSGTNFGFAASGYYCYWLGLLTPTLSRLKRSAEFWFCCYGFEMPLTKRLFWLLLMLSNSNTSTCFWMKDDVFSTFVLGPDKRSSIRSNEGAPLLVSAGFGFELVVVSGPPKSKSNYSGF